MGTLCSQLELNQEAGWQVKAKLGTPGGGHDPGKGGGKSLSTSSEHGGQHPQHQNPGPASSWPITHLLHPYGRGKFLPAVPCGLHCLKDRVILRPLATFGET